MVKVTKDIQNQLGEGPVWDEQAQILWWVDITQGMIFRYDPGSDEVATFDVGQPVGTLGLRQAGGLILATASGFAFYDPDSRSLHPIADPEADKPGNRFNDGKPDPSGSFYAGTMGDKMAPLAGALYRLTPDGTITVVKKEVTISNGIAWNGAEDLMYYIDSPTFNVMVFDFDRATGVASNGRVAFAIDREMGTPDGMTIDHEDNLWIAHFGGGAVSRWNPQTGSLMQKVELPVTQVTCCVFGGANLDTLYITTARIGLSADQLAKEPLAGALFECSVGVHGRPAYRFQG